MVSRVGCVPMTWMKSGPMPISSRVSRRAAADRVAVGRLDAPARETDLAGMMVQVRGAAREQHVQPRLALDQRHQHRGLACPGIGIPARHEGLGEQGLDPPIDRMPKRLADDVQLQTCRRQRRQRRAGQDRLDLGIETRGAIPCPGPESDTT